MSKARVSIALVLLLAAALIGLLVQRPAAPMEFSSRVHVNIPPQQAWDLLSDLSIAHNYVPGIVRTELATENRRGVGASRRVYSSSSEFINETVTHWEEGSGFTLRLHDESGRAPLPFKSARFSYRLVGPSDGASVVEINLTATFPGGKLGEWLARQVMQGAIQKRTDAVAAGLKVFYESGWDEKRAVVEG